jgi:hypothetical protein
MARIDRSVLNRVGDHLTLVAKEMRLTKVTQQQALEWLLHQALDRIKQKAQDDAQMEE